MATTPQQKARASRISQTDIPSITLEKACRIPRLIADNYASDPTTPFDVATAANMAPSSGSFRTLCGAAIGYGLTDGGPNATVISLTRLGQSVVSPLEIGADITSLRQAALKPTVAQQFYEKYDKSPLPPKDIAMNVLASFGVPRPKTEAVYDLLVENAKFVGFITSIKGKDYIKLDSHQGISDATPSEDAEYEEQPISDTPPIEPVEDSRMCLHNEPSLSPAKNAIFVGHGGNRRPMEQLVKILNEYGIPHKEAVDEPNHARPIPQKVADTMRQCGAAILVFTADKEYFDKNGNAIWRPSENVSHELGAASVLYGERIIIFKENGIDLPSNFSSIGYIEFDKDRLQEKGIDLFRELVSMKILSVSVS